jgi:hypothetical protein
VGQPEQPKPSATHNASLKHQQHIKGLYHQSLILTETQARTNKNIPFGLAKITDLSKSYLNEIEKEKVSQNR